MQKKILLIEDEATVRNFMRDFFEDRDYAMTVAEDGLVGWKKFQDENYDLVVCDMLMPGLLGLEVLKRIKEVKPRQQVIMLTGVKEQSLMEKAKELGCRFYLKKPFSLAELQARVQECLQ